MENTSAMSKKEARREELVRRAGELAMYYYRERGGTAPRPQSAPAPTRWICA